MSEKDLERFFNNVQKFQKPERVSRVTLQFYDDDTFTMSVAGDLTPTVFAVVQDLAARSEWNSDPEQVKEKPA